MLFLLDSEVMTLAEGQAKGDGLAEDD